MIETMIFRGKYRIRTWLRAHLPYALSDRIPKGAKDCGNHEWYLQDETHQACYHCRIGFGETPVFDDAPAPEEVSATAGFPLTR